MQKRGRKLAGLQIRVEKGFLFISVVVSLATILSLSFIGVPASLAQDNSPVIWQVQALDPDRTGLSNPVGLSYSSRANAFRVLEGQGNNRTADLVKLSPLAERVAVERITAAVQDPINLAFDNTANRLLFFPGASGQLFEIHEDPEGNLDPRTLARRDIRRWGVQQPQGLAVDGSGVVYILDAAGPRLVRIEPGAGSDLEAAAISEINLTLESPRGIAFDGTTGHLHVLVPSEQKLYELSLGGEVVHIHDLAEFELTNPQGMVFAPSGDQTDDPGQLSLFVADGANAQGTGQIVELSLVTPAALPAGMTMLPASLVRTFDTSTWNHPSPDPGGIDYYPLTGGFLITDSEIEEAVNGNPPAYWHGYNVFLSSLSGTLNRNCTTFTSSPVSLAYNNFANEPTGVAINHTNNHIFITNDGSKGKLFEIKPGTDGNYCTPDDVVTSRNVASLYGATDAEDVAYGNNTAFIADGTNAEVRVIPMGADGILSADDGPVTHWDTAVLGFHDVEGIGYNPVNGTLFIVSTQGSENYLGEVSQTGRLLRAYSLSFMGTQKNIRSDVTFAPSSQNPSVANIYIVSRGVDNNTNRLANDGKVWEINISNTSLPSPTSPPASTPTATATSSVPSTPGPSPTPTSMPPVTDVIFADGFESGNLSAWTSSVIDGGDLSVSSAAALAGTRGLQALIDDNIAMYLTDDRPNAEPRYRARFYFHPNSISMANDDSHYIFMGYTGTSTAIVRGALRFYNGAYQIRFGLLDDSGIWQNMNLFPISNASHVIEIDWRGSTAAGANNGGLTVWVDGTQVANLTGIDNDTSRIDRVRIGAVSGIDSGTRGTIYFDAFESRRQTYIGP